jgi:hypothetical protein
MKFSIVLCSVSVATALQLPPWTGFGHWEAPGPKDVRGPCPMLNTLANHGFLPHDGRDFHLETTIAALQNGLNFDPQLSTFLHNQALTSNTEPNATTWSLETLRNHNILEHDASFTRADYYFFNDSHSFDGEAYKETKSYWTAPIVDLEMAAKARYARIQTSKATNPEYSLSEKGSNFGIGEAAAYVIILGDKVTGTVKQSLIEYFFENERLPLELGWRRPDTPFTMDELFAAMDIVRGFTPGADAAEPRVVDKRNIHGYAY